MPRPCHKAHNLMPDACDLCHKSLHDERYRVLWGLLDEQMAPSTPEPGPHVKRRASPDKPRLPKGVPP